MKKVIGVSNKIKDVSKRLVKDFSEKTKKPVFILGVVFWMALLLFFGLSSIISFRVANVFNNQEIFGIQGYSLFIGLFILLGILLFIVWKKMIKGREEGEFVKQI